MSLPYVSSLPQIAWIALAFNLAVSTFGFGVIFYLIVVVSSFFIGMILMIYVKGSMEGKVWRVEEEQMVMPSPSAGLLKIVCETQQFSPRYKQDRRMTGSNIIDDAVHEFLDFLDRDFIQSWHRKISDEKSYSIREILEKVVVAFAARSKDVNLVPYVTTQLVDDFASHIRLYKKALKKCQESNEDVSKPPPDLVTTFFDLEMEMEGCCRFKICTSEESELDFLQEVVEVLLYLLLPAQDFHNKPFRYIAREVVVNHTFKPLINDLSRPDYINQMISWLTKPSMFSPETFLTVIRTTDCIEELQATLHQLNKDITRHRSCDTGGKNDAEIKQQLSSLNYVKGQCELRLKFLQQGGKDCVDIGTAVLVPGNKLYLLPFDVVLNNNTALQHFMDYMGSIGAQHYLFFYLAVEGFRVSAEQQLAASLLAGHDCSQLESVRQAALSIYKQYLADKALPCIPCDSTLRDNVLKTIRAKQPSESVFDEIQAEVWLKMRDEPTYFPSFKKSQVYLKLLNELDLLTASGIDETKMDDALASSNDGSKVGSGASSTDELHSSCESLDDATTKMPPPCLTEYSLTAQITNTGVCREHGKSFAVYLVSINKTTSNGDEETWSVYRRYNDFFEFHNYVQMMYPLLSLTLPSKKAFNNLTKEFLDRRKIALNGYLKALISPSTETCHPGLQDVVLKFLQDYQWDKAVLRHSKKVTNTWQAPMTSVSKLVRSMPDNFADGLIKMSGSFMNLPGNMLEGVGKVLNSKMGLLLANQQNGKEGKVGAQLSVEDADNIPLRIMLLLMDEVFDLKTRNMWLRRRVVAILRQIIKTMFGDSINRKIVEYVQELTSAEQVADYIKSLRDQLWPGGILAEAQEHRDEEAQMCARVVAKAKMLGTIDEELKNFLGSDTTKVGVLLVFNMFQNQAFNKRLFYVIVEGILKTIFHNNKFTEVLQKIYAQSSRNQKK